MSALTGKLRRRVFGIAPRETTFARRGFEAARPVVRRRMETIGATFVEGYHAALERGTSVAAHLDTIELERRGWAYEGAAMGLALLDCLSPFTRNRVETFLAGPADPHAYMVHIGAGWVLARLRRPRAGFVRRLDPLLRPLVYDGYGFHEGYFHWRRSIAGRRTPRGLAAYALRAFDQGLGRSLWFVKGADAGRILAAVSAFDEPRRGDLFSGVGLACAYAGGVDLAAVQAIRAISKEYAPQVAQGAAFAAKARQRAGNPAAHTDDACRILCGVSAEAAAAATDGALDELDEFESGPLPRYEQWRRRVQGRFADTAPLVGVGASVGVVGGRP